MAGQLPPGEFLVLGQGYSELGKGTGGCLCRFFLKELLLERQNYREGEPDLVFSSSYLNWLQ